MIKKFTYHRTSRIQPSSLGVLIFFPFKLQLLNAPSGAVAAPAATNKVAQAESAGTGDGGIDDDLQARLDNLRRM